MSDPGIDLVPTPDAPDAEPTEPAADAPEQEQEPDFHALAEQAEGLLAQEGDQIPVPRNVVERWNKEAQSYRERYQPIERALSRAPDADRQTWTQVMADLYDDNPQIRSEAASWMREAVAAHIIDEQPASQQAATAQAVDQAQDEGFDPLDPEAFEKRVNSIVEQRIKADRDERDIEAARQQLNEKARALGYKPDAKEGDAARAAYQHLLLVANERFRGQPDALDKAHEAIEQALNDRATEILKKKGADATLPTTSPDGAAPSGKQEPKTLEDAERAARERMARAFES